MRCMGSRGFTLIDLMISVAVVAILVAIAVPSYSAYVTRAQRAAAKAALQQAAQFLERNYTTTGCYNFSGACVGGTAITAPTPANAPNDGGQFTYALTVAFPDAQSFVLSATPCGAAGTCAGGSTFNDATCGTLLLDNTGQLGINVTGTADYTSAAASSCWHH
jgi:type IV pilus assembly protein PilE